MLNWILSDTGLGHNTVKILVYGRLFWSHYTNCPVCLSSRILISTVKLKTALTHSCGCKRFFISSNNASSLLKKKRDFLAIFKSGLTFSINHQNPACTELQLLFMSDG